MSETEKCQCADCGAWLRILDTPAGERPNYRAGKTVEGHTTEECLLNKLSTATAKLAAAQAENERLRAALELERRFSAYCRKSALAAGQTPMSHAEFVSMPVNVGLWRLFLGKAAKAEVE